MGDPAEGFKNIASEWEDAHLYSPSPRHRRRIISGIISKLEFDSCLDAGCAQPYLLMVLKDQKRNFFGCDISNKVIAVNKKLFPEAGFEEVDISKGVYPGNKKFDLVLSSEVLEHIEDWRSAVKNLATMSKKFLLITVPCGKTLNIDRMIGHLRHYKQDELKTELEKNGCRVILYRHWGFPFHTIYRYLINSGAYYKKIYKNFGSSRYGAMQKIISQILYYLFYVNDLFSFGEQLFIVAEKM